MVDTLFFVHPDGIAAEEIAGRYRTRGWEVSVCAPDASDALDRIAQTRPVAAVFCLDGDCADDVRALAENVLGDSRLFRPLMVFVGGSPDDIAQARAMMPFGVFVSEDELPWVLKRLAIKS